jgi:hypothetical protein
MRFRSPIALALAIAAVWTMSPAAAPSRIEEMLARAGAYVADFVQRFSNIVAEERFAQDSRIVGGQRKTARKGQEMVVQGTTVHRELVSDFLLVQAPGLAGWHTFRDVAEVDGRPVRDRGDRLTELFLQPSAAAVERARDIDREGARYNFGDPARTINNPLLALGFLQSVYQPRFRFSLQPGESDLGRDVSIIEYREQARPTLLRRRSPDADLPARGRFWIEERTGRVVKTELTVSDDDDITTRFRFDERFQIAVPVEMRESYWSGGGYVTGVARYDHFRQFTVVTEEKLR